MTHTSLEMIPKGDRSWRPQPSSRSMRWKPTYIKRMRKFITASTSLFFPALVYLVTLYCAATSSHRYSPLGLVSPEHGILLLNVLSKAGDIALAASAESAWSSIKFMVVARNSPTSLSTVFALSSSIGWTGLFGIMTQRRIFVACNESTWAFLRYVVVP